MMQMMKGQVDAWNEILNMIILDGNKTSNEIKEEMHRKSVISSEVKDLIYLFCRK